LKCNKTVIVLNISHMN